MNTLRRDEDNSGFDFVSLKPGEEFFIIEAAFVAGRQVHILVSKPNRRQIKLVVYEVKDNIIKGKTERILSSGEDEKICEGKACSSGFRNDLRAKYHKGHLKLYIDEFEVD